MRTRRLWLGLAVGAFAVGLAPSGSKDPFALRRAEAVLVRIAWRLPWLDLPSATRWALDGYDGRDGGPDLRGRSGEDVPQLLDFLFERFGVAAPRRVPGVRYDEINAVLSFAREVFVAADLLERVGAMQAFRSSDDFHALGEPVPGSWSG